MDDATSLGAHGCAIRTFRQFLLESEVFSASVRVARRDPREFIARFQKNTVAYFK